MLHIRSTSRFVCGRKTECTKLLDGIRRNNAILLYGGRQAGKTTLLLHVKSIMSSVRADVTQLSSLDLPVYIDLTVLAYDATPREFFRLLIQRTLQSCAQQIAGFSLPIEDRQSSLDDFVASLHRVRMATGEVDVRPVFLFDEAKRVLGERFPRGFQDNLFSLLFGELSDSANCVMVFAGAQHLIEFSRDDTSPIGSRASSVILRNLEPDAIRELASKVLSSAEQQRIDDVSSYVAKATGGHAGLAAIFLEAVRSESGGKSLVTIGESVYEHALALFENWALSLSPEAQAITPHLDPTRGLRLADVANHLVQSEMSKFLARRVFDELQYTGVARVQDDGLYQCNELYWRYLAEFGFDRSGASSEGNLWALIEQTELALRNWISSALIAKYGTGFEVQIEKILGSKAWEAIIAMKNKSVRQYKYSVAPPVRDTMSCMYLGQLGTLMTHGDTWAQFRESFRDKRELEDKIAAISPVRNDRAHFSPVPQKESDRCRLACDDLLVIAERVMASQGVR